MLPPLSAGFYHPTPSYDDTTTQFNARPVALAYKGNFNPQFRRPSGAVLLGVNVNWNIPVLLCRALSRLPALWWGLRCTLTIWVSYC